MQRHHDLIISFFLPITVIIMTEIIKPIEKEVLKLKPTDLKAHRLYIGRNACLARATAEKQQLIDEEARK